MSMLSEKRVEELLALTTKMIQAPSYSGQENLVVDATRKLCDERKFTDIHMDRCGSCICYIRGFKPGPRTLFDGHMDTVPIPDKAKQDHDPFNAGIVDGRMCGRETSSVKGILSAMLATALYYAEGTGYDFPNDIYIVDVVHEECFKSVAVREISVYAEPDCVIVGEASQLNIKIGQRGRAEVVVEASGAPAHSTNPHKGVDAVYKMCKVIEEINKLTLPHHGMLGDGVSELVDVKSSPYPGASVVPDYCHATYDRRLLTDETKESVLAPLQELLNGMMREDPQLKTKVSYAIGQEKCWTGETIETERFFPGRLFDKNEDWVQNIYKEMKKIGPNPITINYDFYTNAGHYTGEAGIHSVGVGPPLETLAHTINEYIEIGQLSKVVESYYGVVKALLKQDR